MALISCPDCGKEFSDAASKCPGCGRPNERMKTSRNTWGCLVLVIVLVVGAYLITVLG